MTQPAMSPRQLKPVTLRTTSSKAILDSALNPEAPTSSAMTALEHGSLSRGQPISGMTVFRTHQSQLQASSSSGRQLPVPRAAVNPDASTRKSFYGHLHTRAAKAPPTGMLPPYSLENKLESIVWKPASAQFNVNSSKNVKGLLPGLSHMKPVESLDSAPEARHRADTSGPFFSHAVFPVQPKSTPASSRSLIPRGISRPPITLSSSSNMQIATGSDTSGAHEDRMYHVQGPVVVIQDSEAQHLHRSGLDQIFAQHPDIAAVMQAPRAVATQYHIHSDKQKFASAPIVNSIIGKIPRRTPPVAAHLDGDGATATSASQPSTPSNVSKVEASQSARQKHTHMNKLIAEPNAPEGRTTTGSQDLFVSHVRDSLRSDKLPHQTTTAYNSLQATEEPSKPLDAIAVRSASAWLRDREPTEHSSTAQEAVKDPVYNNMSHSPPAGRETSHMQLNITSNKSSRAQDGNCHLLLQ